MTLPQRLKLVCLCECESQASLVCESRRWRSNVSTLLTLSWLCFLFLSFFFSFESLIRSWMIFFTRRSQFSAPSRRVCQDRLTGIKKEPTEGFISVLIFKKAAEGKFRHRLSLCSDRRFNRNRIEFGNFWQLCFDGNRRLVSSKQPLQSLAGGGSLLTNIWIPLLKHNSFLFSHFEESSRVPPPAPAFNILWNVPQEWSISAVITLWCSRACR